MSGSRGRKSCVERGGWSCRGIMQVLGNSVLVLACRTCLLLCRIDGSALRDMKQGPIIDSEDDKRRVFRCGIEELHNFTHDSRLER